mgnify:CR=1 FL=1
MDGTSIGYDSPVYEEYSPTAYQYAQNSVADYQAVIQKIKDAGFYVIGRLTTFNDSFFCQDHPEYAIADGSGDPLYVAASYWPSAFCRYVWEYKVALAIDAVQTMGFDEIQFDYVRFPDNTDQYEASGDIDFRNEYGETKAQAIQRFLMYATDILHEYGVYVGADVFGETSGNYVTAYGQYWPAISNVVDVISGMPYPDHFARNGAYRPWEHPYETLLDWAENHKGARKYVAFADKCWPAFPEQFGFEPCYVNSRLASRGIPVACEVDIYGALSEYIGACISHDAVTLLDINNSVPKDMYKESIEGKFDYTHKDTFMGFHCGNTCSKKLASCEMKNQMIMARSLPVEVTNGTLEGDIAPGDITFYRLQSTSDNKLRAYVAQGEVLPVATRSFGSIGVFAIHEMGRFYRHVLIEKNYPHHGAVAFGHYGKALFEVFKYIGVPMEDINYNQPASLPYPTENPFA